MNACNNYMHFDQAFMDVALMVYSDRVDGLAQYPQL